MSLHVIKKCLKFSSWFLSASSFVPPSPLISMSSAMIYTPCKPSSVCISFLWKTSGAALIAIGFLSQWNRPNRWQTGLFTQLHVPKSMLYSEFWKYVIDGRERKMSPFQCSVQWFRIYANLGFPIGFDHFHHAAYPVTAAFHWCNIVFSF